MHSAPGDTPPADIALDSEGSGRLGRLMSTDLAAQLRAQINSGGLGPGDRLPNERDHANAMGVARLTVREAIKILVTEGYLITKRGKAGGTFVSDLKRPQQAWLEQIGRDPTWAIELMEYRTAVEMYAAELAAIRRSEDQLATMATAIEEGATADSRIAYRRADHRFHVAVAEASGNERLRNAIAHARGELFLSVDRMSYQDSFALTREEHNAIYDAIKAQDREAARHAAEKHMQTSLEFVSLVAKQALSTDSRTSD